MRRLKPPEDCGAATGSPPGIRRLKRELDEVAAGASTAAGAAVCADTHVGACLALFGASVDRANRFTVHEDDALVAIADSRQESLCDQRFAGTLKEHLHQGREVAVIFLHPEDARTAIAIKRLDDDVAVVVAEGFDRLQVA